MCVVVISSEVALAAARGHLKWAVLAINLFLTALRLGECFGLFCTFRGCSDEVRTRCVCGSAI